MIYELLLAEEAVETGWIEKVFTNPWYTGLGTLASLLGILVTFIQVTRTRRTSSLVKKEVVSAKLKIKAFLDIASVTKISSEIELTRENIRIVANTKLQIFGDLPKGLSPFLSAQFNFLSDTNKLLYVLQKHCFY